jgi:hypothetical protein
MTRISFNPSFGSEYVAAKPANKTTAEERKHNQEKVAAGVGGAAGLSKTATKMAGKRGLKAEAAEHGLQNMMESVERTTRAAKKNTEAAKGLWSTFKANIKFYTNDIIKRLESLKNSKYIGPILNNPVTKKLAAAAGGALAFFVLVTGINKAVKTGSIAVDDFKQQYREYRAAA